MTTANMPNLKDYITIPSFVDFNPFAKEFFSDSSYIPLAAYQVDGKVKKDSGEVVNVKLSLVVNVIGYWKTAAIASVYDPATGRVLDHIASERNDDSSDKAFNRIIKAIGRVGELDLADEGREFYLRAPANASRNKASSFFEDEIKAAPLQKFLGEEIFATINSDSNNIAIGTDFNQFINGFTDSHAQNKSNLQSYNRAVKAAEEEERRMRAEIEARINVCGEAWASW